MIITIPEERDPKSEAEYRRLVISSFDLGETAEFLNRLLAMGEVRNNEDSYSLDLRRAWTIAAIVAYCRPFTRNHGAANTKARLLIDEVAGLTDEQRALHKRLVEKRDKIYAHSDAEMADLEYQRDHPNGPVPRIRDRRVALSFDQAREFHALAVDVRRWIGGRATLLSGVPIMGSRRGAPGDG